MSIRIKVSGDFAVFSRPEMKVERVSYDVITPSAARGIIEAIYWHPGLSWVIDRIYVCNPIRFTSIKRNEVNDIISARTVKTVMNKGEGTLGIYTRKAIEQRTSQVLRDVSYVIDAHFDLVPGMMTPLDNEGKFQDTITRRVNKGQYYHQPYFGCREFPVVFEPCVEDPICPNELRGTIDLGWMLYDMDYSDAKNIKPLFFRAVLTEGVLNVPQRGSREIVG